MPNFEFVFKKVVRIWRGKEIVKNQGVFKRILVAPDKETASQIAQAMVGEMIKDVEGWEIEGWDAENLKPREKYEIGLGDLISVSQTTAEPTMGSLPHPIPNYNYIWDRVKDKLSWFPLKGVAIQFHCVEKTHWLRETSIIDGIMVKHSEGSLCAKHILGVIAIHRREFQSYEEAESFLQSLPAAT